MCNHTTKYHFGAQIVTVMKLSSEWGIHEQIELFSILYFSNQFIQKL